LGLLTMKRLYPIFLILLLAACGGAPGDAHTPLPTIPPIWLTYPPTPPVTPRSGAPQPALPEAATPTVAVVPTAVKTTAVPTAATAVPTTPADARISLSADAALPPELLAAAQQLSDAPPAAFTWRAAAADGVHLALDTGSPVARWVYAVAAPFATIADGITPADVAEAWQTGRSAAGQLVLDSETAVTWSARWGAPHPDVLVTPAGQLVETLWAQRPAFTLLPFQRLTPELKVLRLDGVSPLDADFVLETYSLVITVGAVGSETAVAALQSAWPGPRLNRDVRQLTRVAMTGVTALVRATAHQMELNGVTYPGEEVGPVLRAADIAHVSNEVSFAPDCPYPNPIGGTTFCSRDAYFELLESIGADVIELTGNHLNDWGSANLARTLEMYANAGMATFGGGRDLAEAAEPALFTHNGNRIAFVGCNDFGPAFAWATADSPGSRPCGPDFTEQIRSLRDAGYLVIATLQYAEFYHYAPTPQQAADFAAAAAAGATAVSGSQGHHAQGFAFHEGAFIHYGLGNLFFDQMNMLGTRQTFVDAYVIYEGRLLSVELWTGLIENYARPRLMTPEERAEALRALFQASGW
jgi:hypothetical protein